MKLHTIKLQEPDHITPGDINTFEKCQDNNLVSLHTTRGRGKHHGKRYYSGKFKSKDLPIKINGILYEDASIQTAEVGEKAKVKGHITHSYNRLKDLANAFNDRLDSKYVPATQRIWEQIIQDYPEYKSMSQSRKLARWLQLFSYIEFGKDGRLSQPRRFVYSSRFNSHMYGILKAYIPLPDSGEWKKMKPFWEKATSIDFEQQPVTI